VEGVIDDSAPGLAGREVTLTGLEGREASPVFAD